MFWTIFMEKKIGNITNITIIINFHSFLDELERLLTCPPPSHPPFTIFANEYRQYIHNI